MKLNLHLIQILDICARFDPSGSISNLHNGGTWSWPLLRLWGLHDGRRRLSNLETDHTNAWPNDGQRSWGIYVIT